jgi:2-methylcitrate dehydratase PrpD
MTAGTRLAEFVVKTSLDDCPSEALARVRRQTLDTLGVMLAGAGEPAARIVQEVARTEGGTPLCTVVGTPLRTGPSWAALANGVAGHAHDFDDTSFAMMGHPSVPLLAAALAAAEAEPAGGQAVAAGYVVGFEVAAALGTALGPGHYRHGWHATATVGTLGATATAARVVGLDVRETAQALAIAVSLASGVKENFGSMTKPYHAGHAARNGLHAVQLARLGFTASESAVDGTQGYLAVFGAGPGPAADEALAGLGRRWHLLETGVAVKPYPSCALTHAALDALLELRAAHGLGPDAIADVEVAVTAVTPDVLIYPRPSTPLERKFSMPYCAAVALVDGRVGLDSFAEAAAQRPAVRDLMARVRMVVDPALPERLETQAWSRVRLRLADGRTLATPARGASGHPDRPLDAAALRAKFLACTAGVLPPETAEALAEQVEHLEDIPDIRALTDRLTPEPP